MPPKYKSRKRVASEDSEDNTATASKRSKANDKEVSDASPVSTEMQIDKEGCEYWDISRTRRIQISNFKNIYTINIREFYEKDGEKLPGKKGINLPIGQLASFIEILPQLERILKAKGERVPRPEYSDEGSAKEASSSVKQEKEKAGEEDGDEEEETSGASSAAMLAQFKHDKKNHEAASDEEE